MPVVTVRPSREGAEAGIDHVTADRKAAIHKGVSEVLRDILGKPLDWGWTIFQEMEMENWGSGAIPAAAFRRHQAARAGWAHRSRGNTP